MPTLSRATTLSFGFAPSSMATLAQRVVGGRETFARDLRQVERQSGSVDGLALTARRHARLYGDSRTVRRLQPGDRRRWRY